MVCEWGMSDKLGPLAYGKKSEQVFLGRGSSGNAKTYSEQTAREIDNEIHRIVSEGYDRARTLIEDHLDQLEAIAQGLLEFETLDANDVKMLADGSSLDDLRVRKTKDSKREKEADKQQEKLVEKRGKIKSDLEDLIDSTSNNLDEVVDQLKLSEDAAKLIKKEVNQQPEVNLPLVDEEPTDTAKDDGQPKTKTDSDDELPPSLLGPRK
jgi:gas vesicle protein